MSGYRIVQKASNLIIAICGYQQYDSNKKYKLSDFVVKTIDRDVSLYFSCLTGELVEVSDTDSAYEYLINHWFYIEYGVNEKINVPKLHKLIQSLRLNQKKSITDFQIITTTECNANCFYCYEAKYRKMSMSTMTADKVVDFIAKYASGNKVKVMWYGGEPLLNSNIIDYISVKLASTGIEYTSSIISNGLLFTDSIVDRAMESWNLTNARITLDGTEQIYNKIKAYKDTSVNSFSLVISNIEKLINAGISVTIRINVGQYNINDVFILVDQLCDRFIDTKLINFMIRTLRNTENNHNIEGDRQIQVELLKQIIQLQDLIYNAGFDLFNGQISSYLTYNFCRADSGSFIIVKPNGELTFCGENFNEDCKGSIFDEKSILQIPDMTRDVYPKKEVCDNCPRYIMCQPSKLCPAMKTPICSEAEKMFVMHNLDLSIKEKYRHFLHT